MDIYLIALASLLFSALFSGVEIAYISANKLRIELKRKQGKLYGKLLADLVKDPSRFLGTTLIGNNIAIVVYSLMMGKILKPFIIGFLMAIDESLPGEFLVLLFQALISTFIILVLGEFLPKALFRLNPDIILQYLSYPLFALNWIFKPLTYSITNISEYLLNKAFGTSLENIQPAFNKVDLEHFVRQTSGTKEEANDIDADMFENALYLTQVKVRECMVPRTEIEAVEDNTAIPELLQKFIDTGFSKLIVYKEKIDDIQGYIHNLDLLSKPKTLKSILMDIPVVPETMPAKELMELFKKQHKSIAWVVDEFGGTAGIVTLEDLLEEIFGEIEDEHDAPEFIQKQISANEFIFSGRLEIDMLNDEYEIDIPEGEYETLAGFIVNRLESIPKMKEVVRIDQFEFTILSGTNTRIETVKLKINKE